MRNCENTKRCTSMNSTNGGSELQQENSRAEQGAWKDGALDDLLGIHATAAPLWSATGKFTRSKLQNLDMRIQRSQNSPASGDVEARWRA